MYIYIHICADIYAHIYIYIYVHIYTYMRICMRMHYAGTCAEWRARRPSAPPHRRRRDWPLACAASRLRVCMASTQVGPSARCSRRPRGGDRRTGTSAPRLPGLVRVGLQNNRAPATTGMRIHQPPPCMCDRTCQYRPAVYARAHQMHPRARVRVRASRIRFQSALRPGMCMFPGLPVPLTTRALAACGRAGPGGSCGQIALKTRPPS